MNELLKKAQESVLALIRKWWKKAAVCLAISIVLAVCMEWLQVLTQPTTYEAVVTDRTEQKALSLEDAILTECKTDGDAVRVDGGPAEIWIMFNEALPMNHVAVKFTQAPEEEGVMRLLYAGVDEYCTLDQSWQISYEAGKDQADIYFDEGEYIQLKLQVAGTVSIGGIEYSTIHFSTAPVVDPLHADRIVTVAVILFAVMLLLFNIHGWTKCKTAVLNAKNGICADWKSTVINAVIFCAVTAVTYLFLRWYVPHLFGKLYNPIYRIFVVSASLACGSLFCFRKTLARKPEVFFLIFCLLIGGNQAVLAPDTSNICWDDGYHYLNAMEYSYLGEKRLTTQDNVVLTPWPAQEYKTTSLDYWHGQQDKLYNEGMVIYEKTGLSDKNFWSAFSGLGLYLGRVLKLPYHNIWELGRVFNLLAYAIVGYFAIRRLKSGKMMLASVLLIPQCLFLAASYSYDPGVISLIALGTSYCFAEWQEKDQKLKASNAAIMIAAMFLGSYTKGVYFPILVMPMFLPKEKFRNKKQRILFISVLAAALILLILSFALPYLTPASGGSGDAAAALEISEENGFVNPSAQIQYILNNPGIYTNILLTALWNVFKPEQANGLLTFFAYLGRMPFSYFYLVLLAVVAFTDKGESDLELSRRGWMRVLFQFLLFGAVCLAATSMYIIFTAYSAGQIEGFQYRYGLPVVFPAMMLLGSGKIRNEMNKAVYHGILFAVIGFVGFSDILYAFVQFFT